MKKMQESYFMIPAFLLTNFFAAVIPVFQIIMLRSVCNLICYFSSKIFSILANFTQTTKISAAVVRSSKLG